MNRLTRLNTLTLRLVLAFTFVSALGLVIVALAAGRSTAREFSTYVEHARAMQGMMGRDSPQATPGGMMGPMMGGGTRGSGKGSPQATPGGMMGPMMGAGPWFMGGGSPTAATSEEQFLGRVQRSLWLAGAIALASGVGLGLLLAQGLARPLRRLRVAASAIAQGDLSRRVEVSGGDEVAELGRAFNSMADALEQDQRLRRQLVADISHELRTPLTNIQATLEAMADGVVPLDKEGLASVQDDAVLLNRLVSDLRDLALAEAGQLDIQRTSVDLAELLRGQAERVRPRATAAGVELALALPDGPVVASVDPDRVAQVVHNLLDNALRYTPRGGRVQLALARQAPWLSIRVSDTGPGIAPEHLPHIFQRFYRADPSRSRGTGGTGLGLAIVKELAVAHGGRVSVESQPGQGATFTVLLPAQT